MKNFWLKLKVLYNLCFFLTALLYHPQIVMVDAMITPLTWLPSATVGMVDPLTVIIFDRDGGRAGKSIDILILELILEHKDLVLEVSIFQ